MATQQPTREPTPGRIPAAPGPPKPTPCVEFTLPDPCNLTDLQLPQPSPNLSGPCWPPYPPSSDDPYPAVLSWELGLTDLNPLSLPFQVSYLPRMCLPYPSLSPAQPSSDEEEGERQSPPLEVSDGEADGLEPGPGLLHGETGRAAQPSGPGPGHYVPPAARARPQRSWHRAECVSVSVSVWTFAWVCSASVTVCARPCVGEPTCTSV